MKVEQREPVSSLHGLSGMWMSLALVQTYFQFMDLFSNIGKIAKVHCGWVEGFLLCVFFVLWEEFNCQKHIGFPTVQKSTNQYWMASDEVGPSERKKSALSVSQLCDVSIESVLISATAVFRGFFTFTEWCLNCLIYSALKKPYSRS